MKYRQLLSQLKCQSTWRLFFLSAITLGVYTAHYVKRQTDIINQHLNADDNISKAFPILILISAYASALIMVPYFVVDEGHPVEKVSDMLDRVFGILALIWAFKARRRMNLLVGSTKGERGWFNGLWTFLFTVFYINFKINTLTEDSEAGNTPDLANAP